MSSGSSNATLTPLEIALKESLLPPDFRDVHLYAFSRRTATSDESTKIDRPLPVVAVAQVLKQTDYFSKLLTSGFAESSSTPGASSPSTIRPHALESEYDYESDSDLDEDEIADVVVEGSSAPRDASSSRPGVYPRGKDHSEPSGTTQEELTVGNTRRRQTPCRQILIPNVAYRTLRACIFYLYTGKVNFLPLRSAGRSQVTLSPPSENEAPPCSPKSMYRLAESYGMTALQNLAYGAIVARLNTSNIVQEAFSEFHCRYDQLREHAVSVLVRHYHDGKVQASLKETVTKIVCGGLPHSGALLLSLLGLSVTIQPPGASASSDIWVRSRRCTLQHTMIKSHPCANYSRPDGPERVTTSAGCTY